MKRFAFLLLTTLAGLGSFNSAMARDPAYQDRHFHHYRLYDYYLQQDFGRNEYFGGPEGYLAPAPVAPYKVRYPYYPETIDYIPDRTVVVPAAPTPPRTPTDPGYSYYREWRELDMAR